MKQFIDFFYSFSACAMTFGQYYNNDIFSDTAVIRYKHEMVPKKIRAYVIAGIGTSPTNPRLFSKCQLGVSYKYVEVSITALPDITQYEMHIFNAMVGARFPVTRMTTVVPKVGYMTMWDGDGDHHINWSEGNHFIYGLEFNRRINDALELSVEGLDLRMSGKYYASKVLTVGVKVLLFKKKTYENNICW